MKKPPTKINPSNILPYPTTPFAIGGIPGIAETAATLPCFDSKIKPAIKPIIKSDPDIESAIRNLNINLNKVNLNKTSEQIIKE